MFRQLDDHMLVSGQIAPEDVAEAAAQGVTMIVNNRPDGEIPGQPSSARNFTLKFRFHPIPSAADPNGTKPPDTNHRVVSPLLAYYDLEDRPSRVPALPACAAQ